jgi:hypothetical protein
MTKQDFPRFAAALAAIMDLYDKSISESAGLLWWKALERHPIDDVEQAFARHVQDPEHGCYPPKPADIIRAMGDPKISGWLAPDEAWAIAVNASDESTTVVWCDEIAQAWGAARPVFDIGDEVGARMAFREAYRRMMHEAQQKGASPRWWVTQGHDPQQRADAIREAQNRGLLTQTRAQEMLRHINGTAPSRDQGAVAQLVGSRAGGNVLDFPTAKQRFAALRSDLTADAEEAMTPEKAADVERRRVAAAAMVAANSEKQA